MKAWELFLKGRESELREKKPLTNGSALSTC